MKSKILIAITGLFLLMAGSAWAIPTVDYSIDGNVITYNVTNDLADFGIYRVGFGPASLSVDGSWVLPTGISWWATNGSDWFNADPYVYAGGSINGIKITYTEIPEVINYTVLLFGPAQYEGTGLTVDRLFDRENDIYIYYLKGRFTTPVPEPATLIILGLGLLSIAGLRRKLSGR